MFIIEHNLQIEFVTPFADKNSNKGKTKCRSKYWLIFDVKSNCAIFTGFNYKKIITKIICNVPHTLPFDNCQKHSKIPK